jgi:hypothetical protein
MNTNNSVTGVETIRPSEQTNSCQFAVLAVHNNIILYVGLTLYISRGSSGSIVSDYGLDDRGSIPDKGRGFYF